MEENEFENALTSAVEDGEQSQEDLQNVDTQADIAGSEDIEEGDKTPAELWKARNEYQNGLWKTPDDILKSVEYYQQRYTPLEQSIKKMGFNDVEMFENAFSEYQGNLQKYQQHEQIVNTLNNILSNDEYGGKLRNALSEIQRAQEVKKYGLSFDELPQNVRERIQKGEEANQRLERLEAERAEEAAYKSIEEQVRAIEEISGKYGYEADIQGIIQYCSERNIPPEMIYGEFMKHSFDKLVEAAQRNASLQTAQQKAENKKGSVLTSSKTDVPKVKNTPQTGDELEQALLNAI